MFALKENQLSIVGGLLTTHDGIGVWRALIPAFGAGLSSEHCTICRRSVRLPVWLTECAAAVRKETELYCVSGWVAAWVVCCTLQMMARRSTASSGPEFNLCAHYCSPSPIHSAGLRSPAVICYRSLYWPIGDLLMQAAPVRYNLCFRYALTLLFGWQKGHPACKNIAPAIPHRPRKKPLDFGESGHVMLGRSYF